MCQQRLCVRACAFLPRVTNSFSSTASLAWAMTDRELCECMCVARMYFTHVQVCWDKCRVHGLSSRSSVKIPRLSLPRLQPEQSRLLTLSFSLNSHGSCLLSHGRSYLTFLCFLHEQTLTAAFSMLFPVLKLLSVLPDKHTTTPASSCLADLSSGTSLFLPLH